MERISSVHKPCGVVCYTLILGYTGFLVFLRTVPSIGGVSPCLMLPVCSLPCGGQSTLVVTGCAVDLGSARLKEWCLGYGQPSALQTFLCNILHCSSGICWLPSAFVIAQTCTRSCTGLHVQSPGGALSRARLETIHRIFRATEYLRCVQL